MTGLVQNRLRQFIVAAFVSGVLFGGQFFQVERFPVFAEALAGSLPMAKSGAFHQGHAIAISAQGLQTLIQMDPHLFIVDVRGVGEENSYPGRIKGALHILLEAVKKNPLQFPAGKTLVFVSTTGERGMIAARIVAAHGGVVYWVKGGLKAWHRFSNQRLNREPVKKGNPPPEISRPPDKQKEPWEEMPGDNEEEEQEQEDMGC